MLLSILLAATFQGFLPAQELQGLLKNEPLQLGGSISNQTLYFHGENPAFNRKPLSHTLNAALNLSLYGISMPFSVSWSNERWSYTQPFNRIALHPSWKNIRAHLGDVSLSFSPYSLNGINFRGVGIELQELGPLSVTLMAGRLQKRVLADSLILSDPLCTRMGYGLKTAWTKGSNLAGFSLFYACDNPASLPETDLLHVNPATNLVLELNARIALWKKMYLQIEGAGSYLRKENVHSDSTGKATLIEEMRGSSLLKRALNTQLGWTFRAGSLSFGLERIDPGYQTLGAYYTLNDIQRFSFNYSGNFWKEKLSLAISSGLEEDNLQNMKSQSGRRLANSFNLRFAPSKKLEFSGNYSGFSSYTSLRNPFDNINSLSPYGNIDTLDFTQLSESIHFTASGMLQENDSWSQQMSSNLSFQKSSASGEDKSGSKFLNANAGWMVSHKPTHLNASISLVANNSRLNGSDVLSLGPSLLIRKSLFEKKMQLSNSISYNQTRMAGRIISQVRIMRMNATVRIKNHNLDIALAAAERKKNTVNMTKSDLTVSICWRVLLKNKKPAKGSQATPETPSEKERQLEP